MHLTSNTGIRLIARAPLSLAIAALMLSATGCVTQPKATVMEVSIQDDKPIRTSRHLTVTWDNIGRGGAAMLQPGFVDVLANEQSFGPDQNYIQAPAAKSPFSAAQVAQIKLPMEPAAPAAPVATVKTSNRTSYSTYELQRWERYCSGGVGMGEQDWRFVDGQNHLVPDGVFPSCSPPLHNSQQYRSAWVEFCSGSAISPSQMNVVRNSARPSSVSAKSCKGKLS